MLLISLIMSKYVCSNLALDSDSFCYSHKLMFYFLTGNKFLTVTFSLTAKLAHPKMSEAPGSSYAANFTSVKATKEGKCKTCGTTAVLKHMQNKEHSKLGRDLGPNCYQYYCNKNGTVCCSGMQPLQVEHSASHQHDVHQQVQYFTLPHMIHRIPVDSSGFWICDILSHTGVQNLLESAGLVRRNPLDLSGRICWTLNKSYRDRD